MNCQAFKSNGDQCIADAKYVVINKYRYYCGRHIMSEYNFANSTKYKLKDISNISDIMLIQTNKLIQDIKPSQAINNTIDLFNSVNNEITEYINLEFDTNCIILDKINTSKKIRLYNFKIDSSETSTYIIKIIADPELIDSLYYEYCMYQKIYEHSDTNETDKFVNIITHNNKLMYHRLFKHWVFIVYEKYGEPITTKILNCHSNGVNFTVSQDLIEQMYNIIQLLHSKSIVYSELTPSKFLIDENNIIKLANLYNTILWSDIFNDAIEQKDLIDSNKSKSTELINFGSINYNNKKTTSRIDDFESLLYIIMYLKGIELPWTNATSNTQIRDCKIEFINNPPHYLNSNILEIIKIIRDNHFQQKPNYNKLKSLFIQL